MAAPPAGQPTPSSRRLAGRYLVGRAIGHGGMSTVYRARDELLGRDVAVKVLLPALAEGDPAHVARFEREARAAAALQHPAVIKVYDTGRDGESHFIVMECVAGQSLDRLLVDGRPLEPGRASRIARQVADALAAAHAAGILHRDVKPANVMVTPEGQVKVLDFGIARGRQDPTLTQTAFAIGTAAYMSPERVLGQAGDERSDIYSLGCLLYAMLTGRPPFVADSTLSVLHQQVHDPPRPPSARGAAIAPPLDAFVLSMLAKDPAARPQTASEVAGRLAAPERVTPTAPAPLPHRRRTVQGALVLAGGLAAVVALAASGNSGKPAAAAHRASRAVRPAHHATVRPTPPTSHATRPQTTQPPTAKIPPAKPVPPGDGVPRGHGGVPPGHKDKPPKPPKAPKDHKGKGGPKGRD